MTTAIVPRVSIDNRLLAALPKEEYEQLLPNLERVELSLGEVLHEPGETIRHAFFPNNSVISLLTMMESGATTEVGLVGNEGLLGLPLFLGGNTASNQAVVQVAGSAMRMKAGIFRDACDRSGVLRDLLHLYTQALLTQTSQAAACNRLHSLEERFARWLLSIHDRIEGDEFKLTQELISHMLGVRRAGVTGAAIKLQQDEAISYHRGHIKVIDRAALEAISCECYAVVKEEFDRLLNAELMERIGTAKVPVWSGSERRQNERDSTKTLERVREINSRLLIAGIREQEARDEADEANQAKDEFLATLSHELRTPLTAMLGWSRMLRTTNLDKAASTRALEIIERNANAQVQLIEDLLDVSRIIAGKLQLDLGALDLAPLIEAAVDVVRPMADAKSIVIECALGSGIDSFNGNQKRLQQIVLNLLTNAVKFTPRGGSVGVRLEQVGGHARLEVSDTGKGINAEFLPHVFDRFRQADSATTRTSSGLGLGLAIVRHLVELHGGTVRAESQGEGQGATFIIEFPLAVGETVESDAARQPRQTIEDVAGKYRVFGSAQRSARAGGG